MQAIWKEKLSGTYRQEIDLPRGSFVLCVQVQKGEPCIWFKVPDVKAVKEKRVFAIYGTGHEHENISGVYIGTFQLFEGNIVFHVFEE